MRKKHFNQVRWLRNGYNYQIMDIKTKRQIIQVKDTDISGKEKESVKQFGRQPQLFATIILSAIAVLIR